MGVHKIGGGSIAQSARPFSACAEQEPSPGKLACIGSYNAVGGFAFSVDSGGNYVPIPAYGGAEYLTWIDGPGMGREFDPSTDTFNYAARSFLTQPAKRWSITASGEDELGMGITAFADGYFTDRHSQAQQAPDPTGFSPGHDIGGFYVPKTNPYNPTGYNLYMYRRPLELGNRVFDTDVQTFRIVAGLRGEFTEVLPKWKWEVSALHGESNTSDTEGPLLLMGNANIALDPTLCAADPNCSAAATAAGQTAMNPFGPTTINSAWIPYISAALHDISNNSLTVYQGNISGPIATLPAGKLQGALGVEYINNAGYYEPDYLKTTGTTDETANPTRGSFHSHEIYGELNAPILAGKPWANYLDLGIALRRGEYSTGNSATTWKTAVNWDPIEDVKLRAIASQATRVPSIVDLYKGSSLSYDFATDPCTMWATTAAPGSNRALNCAFDSVPGGFGGANAGQIPTTYTSNATLRPETARTYTAGVVLQPHDIRGLKVSVDYWRYKITNYIDNLDTTQLLNLCYDGPVGLTSPYCAYHTGRNPIHQIMGNVNPLLNLGYIKTDGVDVEGDYTIPDVGPGNVILQGLLTYTNSWLISPQGDSPEEEAGTSYGGLIYPHWKGQFTATYEANWWGAAAHERWIGSAKDVVNPTSAFYNIPNVFYTDLEGHVDVKSARITVGIDNVFDKQPPFFGSYTDENTDAATYDVVGRFFWTRLSVKM